MIFLKIISKYIKCRYRTVGIGGIPNVEGVTIGGRANLMEIKDAFRVVNVVEEGWGGLMDFVVGELDARHNAFMAS